MKNQGFIPQEKGEKADKNINENQNVYDYYGNNYFNPWFRQFKNNQKEPKTKEGTNEITNQPAPSSSGEINNQMGQQYPPPYDPWGMGYGGFGFGWPPFSMPHHGGFGYGNDQQPYQPNVPPQQQNQPPQQEENGEEGGFDMPFYDPYFGYNYQFGQNQQTNNK